MKKRFQQISLIFGVFIFMLLMMGGATSTSEAAPALTDITLVSRGVSAGNTVGIANTGIAGDMRLFLVQQDGRIQILDLTTDTILATPFLTVSPLSTGGERGLLGVAFHPDYASNGYFYINYTLPSGDTRIARYSVSGDPNIANTAETFLLDISQPFSNHNGGDLHFSPIDGYLYIGTGDGGSFGDPGDRAQRLDVLLGKMLRIDVDGGTPYAIPADNPYVGVSGAMEEIWANGLRNPWRFSFDSANGDLWIGDVGQNTWEEIDYEPAGTAGRNYGWRCYEANHSYDLMGCGAIGSYTFPVHEYNLAGSPCAVVGGYVYHGAQYLSMSDLYFFGDVCSGQIWTLEDPAGTPTVTEMTISGGSTQFALFSFGEDVNGELYLSVGSTVYQVTDPTSPTAVSLDTASAETSPTSLLQSTLIIAATTLLLLTAALRTRKR